MAKPSAAVKAAIAAGDAVAYVLARITEKPEGLSTARLMAGGNPTRRFTDHELEAALLALVTSSTIQCTNGLWWLRDQKAVRNG
jgi:hypothetical protein